MTAQGVSKIKPTYYGLSGTLRPHHRSWPDILWRWPNVTAHCISSSATRADPTAFTSAH